MIMLQGSLDFPYPRFLPITQSKVLIKNYIPPVFIFSDQKLTSQPIRPSKSEFASLDGISYNAAQEGRLGLLEPEERYPVGVDENWNMAAAGYIKEGTGEGTRGAREEYGIPLRGFLRSTSLGLTG